MCVPVMNLLCFEPNSTNFSMLTRKVMHIITRYFLYLRVFLQKWPKSLQTQVQPFPRPRGRSQWFLGTMLRGLSSPLRYHIYIIK